MSNEMDRGGSTLPSPGVAAVLSFVIPGLGQFYNGAFLRGIFWLILTPGPLVLVRRVPRAGSSTSLRPTPPTRYAEPSG